MRISKTSKRFRKNYNKLNRSGIHQMSKLRAVMEQLINGEILSVKHKDHPLKGKWHGFRDCHIEGDWVLIYKIDRDETGNEVIIFSATGNHSNLFK